ncbi:MAG TPA: Ppx/GppA phosphatase family protein [Candidatus Acidoferrales bacterium]|nr:Ppx/GppA phosphatase family protein [Candidatus Acidoferrales bacterium]
MAAPVRIAAIDAGSNAIRLIIAEAKSSAEIQILDIERAPVRLGHRAFTKRRFSRLTMDRAVHAFRRFKQLMDRYGVQHCRAVATSAAREARNRGDLIRRIRRTTGIELEVIDSSEEARLVRSAILGAVSHRLIPRLIVDLGGGSLEISLLRKRTPEKIFAFPLGSVRLMETLGIYGSLSEDEFERVQHRVFSLFRSVWPTPPNLSGAIVVASGGNAEALARIAPGPRVAGIPTVNLRLVRERLWEILGLDVAERMDALHLRRDRAEVIGLASVVFASLAKWLHLRSMLVPGVGVKEGILWDLASSQFSGAAAGAYAARFQPLLREARRVAARFHYEPSHSEQVRRLAGYLFDQLARVHGLPYEMRLPLETAAILHDVGYAIDSSSHHKHGEYIVRHAHIPGLAEADRLLVACLIRYHGKANPDPQHKLYSSLGPRRRFQVRALAAILRIAIALDKERRRAVQNVDVIIGKKGILLRLYSSDRQPLPIRDCRRGAKLFEEVFGRKVHFGRARTARTVSGLEGPLARSHRAA